MSLSHRVLALFAVAASVSAFACAAPTEGASGEEGSTDEAAVNSAKKTCTTQAYDQAFAHYKRAVDGAKVHLRGDICDVGATEFEIASALGAAVATCGKFEEIIKTSQWAAPARDALKTNVALSLVDGTIHVKDAAGKTTWTGLAAGLEGKTLWGPAPGAYGNISKLEMRGAGEATYSRLTLDDNDGMPRWNSSPARYALGAPKADGSVDVTVTVGGASTVYELRLQAPGGDYPLDPHVPLLDLKPKAADGEALSNMPSECEA